MRNLTPLLTAAAIAVAFTACTELKTTPASAKSKATQVARQFSFTKTQHREVKYLLYLPRGYAGKADQKWPLILFLHGAGERGTNVWKVATHGPPKHIAEHQDFPFIVVSPQCPAGEIWSNDVLLELLDEIIRLYPVD